MKLSFSIVFLIISLNCSAQFAYQRSISAIDSSGWYGIPLPTELIAKLNSQLSDIRLYQLTGTDTLQTPYLLRISKDNYRTQHISLMPFNVSYLADMLFITVKPNTEQINSVTFQFKESNYDAVVTVEGSNDQKEWFSLVKGERIIALNEGGIQYNYTTGSFPRSNYAYLRFSIKNKSKLALAAIQFENKIVDAGEFLSINLPLEQQEIKVKDSEWVTTFPKSILLSKLIITPAPDQKFYRSFSIDKISDSLKTEKGWHYYYQPVINGIISSFRNDTLVFPAQHFSKLRLTVHNEDNPPIKINTLTGFSPEVKLVSALQVATYILQYGNSGASYPNYDLTNFENEIPALLQHLTLGDEISLLNEVPKYEPWLTNKIWLWGVLLLIIALIGFFTVRMMKSA